MSKPKQKNSTTKNVSRPKTKWAGILALGLVQTLYFPFALWMAIQPGSLFSFTLFVLSLLFYSHGTKTLDMRSRAEIESSPTSLGLERMGYIGIAAAIVLIGIHVVALAMT